jgi:hypothetical protein
VIFGDCLARHADGEVVVRCELAIGHPPPHAAEVGPKRQLVTWEDESDQAAGEGRRPLASFPTKTYNVLDT